MLGIRARAPEPSFAASKVTLAAALTTTGARRGGSGEVGTAFGRDTQRGEDRVSRQIGFRRALTVAYGMWAAFVLIDWAVVRYLGAGNLAHFVALRFAVLLPVA